MANPLYSTYLDFAPTFKWGGRTFGANDQAAFRAAIGPKRYAQWARNHPTAARVFDPVEQQIYGAYQPQLAAMERERKSQQDYYNRLMQNLGGFANALGGLLSGHPGVVSDAYNQGASTMLSGGNMYGGQLNADQAANAAASNKELSAIDSPATLSGGDAGSVLAGAAGWIPSTMMKEQGSAWSDRLAHMPTEAALQANLMMHDLLGQAASGDQEWLGKINDVLSGLSGDRIKLQQDMQSQQLAQKKAEQDYYLKLSALALSQGKAKEAEMWRRKAYALDLQKEKRYQNKDKGLDIDGNPLPGYKWANPNNHAAGTVKIPKSSSAKGPDWGKLQSSMADDADGLTIEKPDPNPFAPSGSTIKTQMSYKEAYRALWTKYSGLVQNKGRLRRLINQILKAKGFKKPVKPADTPFQGGR